MAKRHDEKADSVPVAEWDSMAAEIRVDQRAAYDRLRARCPVARDAAGTWLLLRHEDVRRAALDDVTFSSAVSRFKSVPNSMDGDEHRRFRSVVDRFLEPARVAALVPMFREVAEKIVAALPRGRTIDAVEDVGVSLAVRAQSRWLGWPAGLEQTLRTWVHDNEEATRSGDLARTRDVAARFDAIVREQVISRRSATTSGLPHLDVTSELMRAIVEDPAVPEGRRSLAEAEAVSILRNWTSGDLGSVARAVGAIVYHVAMNGDLQAELRMHVRDVATLDRAIDEILRIDDPFVQNRRVTTREVQIAGYKVPQGTRVLLNWTAANRDPAVFGTPDEYRPEQNAKHNLVYGIGPHACPGRSLATHELREALIALLLGTSALVPSPDERGTRALPPSGAYARVPVILT